MSKPQTALKWFGGKVYLASAIIKLMPPHTHYVEPYFGGGSVLLAKNPDGISEVVNDLNGDLMNFWEVLRLPHMFAALMRMVQATPFCEQTWLHSCERAAKGIDLVERAWAFFVWNRQSRSGQFKDFATLTRTRTRRRMNEQASAWLTAIEGLPAIHERLKRIVILNRDALDVIRQQDGEQTCFYLDPPYLHETRATKDVYAHEMTAEQHQELLELLADIDGRFLLSGYPSEMYEKVERDEGWRHVDFDLPNNASGAKSKAREVERVWMNF